MFSLPLQHRLIVALALALLAVTLAASPALARFGDYDPAFGNNGLATLRLSEGDDSANAVALQSDGKIVSVGLAYSPITGNDIAVTRWTASGQPDTSFGVGGVVTVPVSAGNDYDTANDVAVQPDGRIVIVGSAKREVPDFALVRLNGDGSLDSTFGAGGIVTTSVNGSTADQIQDVRLMNDGRILVAGRSTYNYVVVRYQANGALDTTLNGTGKLITPIWALGDDWGDQLALAGDGSFLVAGRNHEDSSSVVYRYQASGALDTGFGSNGKLITPIGPDDAYARALEVLDNGKIMVAGYSPSSGFVLMRANADGTPDTSFSGDGAVLDGLHPGFGFPTNYLLLQQPDGKTVVSGYTRLPDNTYDYSLVRYLANGSVDTAFGGGDGLAMAWTGVAAGGTGINNFNVFQPDGKLVATGYVNFEADKDFAVTRLQDYRLNDGDDRQPTRDPKTNDPNNNSNGAPKHDGLGVTVPPKSSPPASRETSAELLLQCSSRPLVLSNVAVVKSRVRLSGVAAASLRGKPVAIVYSNHKTVARTRVGADGHFSATAKLPPRSQRNTNAARYTAVSGKQRSLALKLTRRMTVTSSASSGGAVTITGRISAPLAKPLRPVVLTQRVSCTRYKTVRSFKPSASGAFKVTVRAPEGGGAAVYRLSTQVRRTERSKTPQSTFTLPVALDFGPTSTGGAR